MKTSASYSRVSTPTTATAAAPQPRATRLCSRQDLARLLGMPKSKNPDHAKWSVVLKEDHGAQLTLDVKLNQDHYEMVASVEKEDSDTFSTDLARLQLRLADRGISLEPLVSGNKHAAWYAAGDFSPVKRSTSIHPVARPRQERFDLLTLVAALDAGGRLY